MQQIGSLAIAELIDPRPYKINLPISEVDLQCDLYERVSINSRGSTSKRFHIPMFPPHQNSVDCITFTNDIVSRVGPAA